MKKIVDLNKVIHQEIPPPACDVSLGIKISEAYEGYAKGYWNIKDHLLNGNGVVMGGFVSAAADIIMAYAMTTRLNEHQTFASINLDTTFHRPVFTGKVEIEAAIKKLGKSIAYVQAVLTQNEKRVADAVSSIIIMQKETNIKT
ncbi:PaaI family thioesterase [Bacillus aquiflavi]|uniref:PaaI family thioesterase n=1 Tax=Bacillus aquiflavi TaxID=2672567 RepID=A0A6B3VZS9_9BACI|nr:PaaI family thioesterase [Bacillus aquiflavi]MBA4537511.1 PaaI family thioesterase [Bacillus aquiflavi]NEY81767.1 PaaI family thioesterase [Bacillus aquiflavi]UAC47473.1 PaaI family thioesterase [Bacillus aquiflavi]